MRKLLTFGAVTILSAGAYVACGGDQGASVSPGNDAGLADGAGSDGAGEGGGGGDGGAGGDGAASDAAQDGATVLTADGGSGEDAGPGGSTSQITCGTATCAIPSGSCCIYPNANTPPPPAFYFSCASGACPPPANAGIDPASALKCSLAANCPASTVCCITSDGAPNNISSECKTTCAPAAGSTTAVLCDPSTPAMGCTGSTCSQTNIDSWNLPNGFGTCGGVQNPN